MNIESTVSGMVLRILVSPGDEVLVDQEVVIIEAMKMEIPIEAETAGIVDTILVAEADVVQEGEVLIALKAS
jgi:acetyl-CoA carboxylase biotin carboxyl carrier protein